MATLTLQDVSTAGTAPTYSAAAGGGDSVPYDPNGFVHAKNGSGSAITVTVAVPGTTFGQNNPDVAKSIAAGGDALIKMARGMVNSSTGLIDLTYSGVTSLTLAALRAPAA